MLPLSIWIARGCPVQFVDEKGAHAFTLVLTEKGAEVVDPAPTYSNRDEKAERKKQT